MRRRNPKAERKSGMHEALEALRWQAVLVRANGITYRGILIGADEDELYLKGELRYLVLPMDRVTSIRLAAARDRPARHKSVGPEFYQGEDA